jgi:hypothetical protein
MKSLEDGGAFLHPQKVAFFHNDVAVMKSVRPLGAFYGQKYWWIGGGNAQGA